MRDAADPATGACLRRTRRRVLAVGAAVLGLGLAGQAAAVWQGGAGPAPAWLGTALLVIVGVGFLTLRFGASRAALRDPGTRVQRFERACLAAASAGPAAAVLGLGVAMTAGPSGRALAPCWVAALAAVAMAYPRGHELDDFEEPLPPGATAQPTRPDR